jgi:hypothetical protein
MNYEPDPEFKTYEPGEWCYPIMWPDFFVAQCCGCNMKHAWQFRLTRTGGIGMRSWKIESDADVERLREETKNERANTSVGASNAQAS